MKGLKGKRILITGSSSGIGAGMAKVLAQEGCKLVLHYNRNKLGIQQTLDAVQDLGAEASILKCDFKQLNDLANFFSQAWSVFDGLDGLVNNAGIVSKMMALKDVEGQVFMETLTVNLHAPYLLSIAFAQACINAKQPGAIVNNSSIHGQMTCERFSAYAASKAGLDIVSKVQAIEWGQYQIRVNVLAPGVVPVERTEQILLEPEIIKKWHDKIPAGRYGSTQEMGEATAYLLSDATAWMTGNILTLDGGLIARGNYPRQPQVSGT